MAFARLEQKLVFKKVNKCNKNICPSCVYCTCTLLYNNPRLGVQWRNLKFSHHQQCQHYTPKYVNAIIIQPTMLWAFLVTRYAATELRLSLSAKRFILASSSGRKCRMRPWTGHAAPSPRAHMVCPSICLLSSHNMSISSGFALPSTKNQMEFLFI